MPVCLQPAMQTAAPGLYMLGVGDALTGMLGAFAIESLLLQQTRLMENLIPIDPRFRSYPQNIWT